VRLNELLVELTREHAETLQKHENLQERYSCNTVFSSM
jgi:hypothetical protein